MLLNTGKTKTIHFNFTKNFKFSSRLTVEGQVLESIRETKLLGVFIMTPYLGTQTLEKSCETGKCKNEDVA
jgi:vacuolar-type H+-ATPase catalytic subunit A/Vma1